MAQFKEITFDGEKTVINMDLVRAMKRVDDKTTRIDFDKEHYVFAEETPNDIMMRNSLRNL